MLFKKREEKRKCKYAVGDYTCSRSTLPGDELCIFHSKDIEGKKDKFADKFWKEFERQKKHEKEYDFTGFVFPGDTAFRGIKFEKDVTFNNAQFSKEVHFGGAEFSKAAGFSAAQFSKMADFNGAEFFGMANFIKAQFFEEAIFNGVEFKKKALFRGIILKKHEKFQMTGTYFYNVSGLFEFIEKNKKKLKYSNKTEFLPDNFCLFLGEEATASYQIISRKIRDDMYLLSFRKKYPKLHFIWWLFADCGRSILRWALWSLLFAVLFAFIYYNLYYLNDPTSFYQTHIYKELPGLSFLYYSVVTFTTLGFGDIVPKPGWLQFWVMLEVILGYIMLGGLISIFANKLSRRS